jgi:CBS domain-containing protein
VHPDSLPLPFSHLSPDLKKQVSGHLEPWDHLPGSLIVTQEMSKLDRLLMIMSGQADYFYLRGKERILAGTLGPGDLFGGISILYNDRMAVHCLETATNTRFMCLDASYFLTLAAGNPAIKDFFALALGRCMGHRAFADIMAARVWDRKLTLPFFNQPVSAIFRANIITCDHDDPVSTAVEKMDRHKTSALLVRSPDKTITGIITDADLKSRVMAKGLCRTTPVCRIASSPLATISSQSQVFEAFLTMIKADKRHLVVTGNAGDISGIISEKDLIAAQTRATFLLIRSVTTAKSMADLSGIHTDLEKMLLDPIGTGASADYLTRLIAAFSDAIIDKAVAFSIDEAGPAPCRFVFLTMGSEGRQEQTLISDQDNAIVFEDLKDPAQAAAAKTYFDGLARGICSRLDLAGYKYCDGNNMAQNPTWCQPLSVWKDYLKKWIRSAAPEDLLHSSIFFDFRGTWGDMALAAELKTYLLDAIDKWSGFLRNMTENTTHFKPPIGLFGKFILETKGKHKDAMDIKYAILPIIDFARIYALHNGIPQTNTLDRLFRLYTRHALTSKEYTDLTQAYHFLMGLRFRRQITAIMDEQQSPDNYIYPANLSALDQLMLKEALKMIEKMQQKITIEFTGVA